MAPAGLIVALVVIYLMARIGCLRAYMKRERGECKKPVSQGRIKARDGAGNVPTWVSQVGLPLRAKQGDHHLNIMAFLPQRYAWFLLLSREGLLNI